MKWILAMLVAVMFAGCAAEAPEPVQHDGTPDVEVDRKATTGAIAGIVVDETITPIAGANISIQNSALWTLSDEDGGFAFEDVPPGVYFLEATSTQHSTTATSVEVKAGELSKARVLMKTEFRPEPYLNTVKHDGFVGLWLPGPSYVVQLLYPDENICDCQMQIYPDGNITDFVFEAFWDATVTVPELDQMSWELDSYIGDSLDHQEGEYAESPIYGMVPRETYSAQADNWLARVTPGIAAGFYIQQRYEMFVTSFHIDDAPDGWSINDPGN